MKNIKSFIFGLSLSILMVASVASGIGFGEDFGITTGGSTSSGSGSYDFGAFSLSGSTLTLQNVDLLDATTEATVESAIDSLDNVTSIGGFDYPFTDGGSLTLNSLDALDATSETTIEAAMDTLTNVTSIAGFDYPFSDAGDLTLNGLDALDSTSESTIEAAIDTLANLTTIGSSTGLMKVTSGSISYLTDNTSNWDTAYTHSQLTSGNPHSVSLSDVGISSWAGSENITTLGTITVGQWTGSGIAANYVPNHDDLNGFVANEHIDWTSTSSNLDTSGSVTSVDFETQTAVFTSLYDAGNTGTGLTIDWTDGNYQKSTWTGNVTFTFSAPASVATVTLQLTNDGTGSYTVTWPGTVLWHAGTEPTWTTTASEMNIITCFYNGTNYICDGWTES